MIIDLSLADHLDDVPAPKAASRSMMTTCARQAPRRLHL